MVVVEEEEEEEEETALEWTLVSSSFLQNIVDVTKYQVLNVC